MALKFRALYGALIRALAVLIPAFAFAYFVSACSSTPQPGTNVDSTPCVKDVNGQCTAKDDSGSQEANPTDTTVDSGSSDTDSAPADTAVDDTGMQQDTDVADSIADSTVDDTGSVDTGSADSAPADTAVTDSETTTDSGSDAADSTPPADSGPTDTGVSDTGTTYSTLNCNTPINDTAFAAFKINGTTDVELVGGIWGTSANDYYIPVSDYGSYAAVAHWTGASFVQEDLKNADGMQTTQVSSIWGDSSGNVWVTARAGRGRLYQRVGGTWVEDTTVPVLQDISGVAGPYLVGGLYGDIQAWKHVGSSWVQMTTPTFPNGAVIHRIYWIDDAHAYIAGCVDNTGSGGCEQSLLLAVNGNSWVNVATSMTDTVEIYDVSGNLNDGLYIAGGGRSMSTASGYQAIAYQLDTSFGIIKQVLTPSVGMNSAVLAFAKGLFVTGGQDQVLTTGSGRVTQVDPMGPPATFSAGSASYGVTQFWRVPGTSTAHYVNFAAPGNVAQHYTMSCALN